MEMETEAELQGLEQVVSENFHQVVDMVCRGTSLIRKRPYSRTTIGS